MHHLPSLGQNNDLDFSFFFHDPLEEIGSLQSLGNLKNLYSQDFSTFSDLESNASSTDGYDHDFFDLTKGIFVDNSKGVGRTFANTKPHAQQYHQLNSNLNNISLNSSRIPTQIPNSNSFLPLTKPFHEQCSINPLLLPTVPMDLCPISSTPYAMTKPASVQSNVIRSLAPSQSFSDSSVVFGKSALGKHRISEEIAPIDEKLLASKERNRENARNTRLRKKAFIEKLQNTVDCLVSEKEKKERERRIENQKISEQLMVRTKVMLDFLTHRGSGNLSFQSWNMILDENFVCELPVTPYRGYLQNEIQGNTRKVHGVDGMLTETQSIKLLFESVGKGTEKWYRRLSLSLEEREQIRTVLFAEVIKESLVQQGSKVVCQWKYTTVNGVLNGAKKESEFSGVMYGYFSSKQKLIKVELFFDVMGIIQNLQEAQSTRCIGSIPNTVDKAFRHTREAVVITESEHPYRVIFVNDRWIQILGYPLQEVLGRSLHFLQGPGTDAKELDILLKNVRQHRPASSVLLNYRKDGTTFRNYLRIYPLNGESSFVSHFVGFVEEIPSNQNLQSFTSPIPISLNQPFSAPIATQDLSVLKSEPLPSDDSSAEVNSIPL